MTDEEFKAKIEASKMRCKICNKILDMNDLGCKPYCVFCKKLKEKEQKCQTSDQN